MGLIVAKWQDTVVFFDESTGEAIDLPIVGNPHISDGMVTAELKVEHVVITQDYDRAKAMVGRIAAAHQLDVERGKLRMRIDDLQLQRYILQDNGGNADKIAELLEQENALYGELRELKIK